MATDHSRSVLPHRNTRIYERNLKPWGGTSHCSVSGSNGMRTLFLRCTVWCQSAHDSPTMSIVWVNPFLRIIYFSIFLQVNSLAMKSWAMIMARFAWICPDIETDSDSLKPWTNILVMDGKKLTDFGTEFEMNVTFWPVSYRSWSCTGIIVCWLHNHCQN